MAAKKKNFYFSKPLRLLYSLIIYEIVNFSFFTLYSLLLLSFFLYLKSVPIYMIVHVCHVFSRTVAVVDTKRGYVSMYNGRSAQQESGALLSKNTVFTGGSRPNFIPMCIFLVKA